MYVWGKPDWPTFTWDETSLSRQLAHVSREQGRLLGKMEALGFDLRSETHLRTLTEDVVKSSEIEGEKLEPDQVRSSIARRLGMKIRGQSNNPTGFYSEPKYSDSLIALTPRLA